MYRVHYEELHNLIEVIFNRLQLSKRDSNILADAILMADVYGVDSHGLQRLGIYVKGIREGYMKPTPCYKVVKETPLSATIDGQHSLGQVMGHDAMLMAIDKAKTVGAGIVVVRNSNHIGMGGYYAKLACDEGLLGIALSNTRPIVVPTNGCKSMLGSNPIACAFPAEPFPFFLDMATSVVALGRLEVCVQKGLDLPMGWAIDGNGNSEIDGARALSNINNRVGGLLPLGGAGSILGGHKGFGISILCELLTSVFSLGIPSSQINDETMCQCYISINPEIFGDRDSMIQLFSKFLDDIRNSPSIDSTNKIITQGEKEYYVSKERMANGIPVNEKVLSDLKRIAEELCINFNEYVRCC